jgi:predicted XRE-type DNA-binding protein
MIKGKIPSRRLTFDDAIKVWAMFRAGEFQHRIAAYFDVNPGRVNEVIKGKRHVGSRDAFPPMI